MTGPRMLPYGRQLIEDDDIAAVADCLRGDWLTTGPTVAAFEAEFGRRSGAAHSVVCSSGTAALHLAAAALDIEPGAAAVVPSMTFSATANCVRYCGGEVVFADVDPDTGLAGPEHLAEALTRAGGRDVQALFVVHVNGHIADMPAVAGLAERHGLPVIEDACHALGGSYAANGVQHPVGACVHSRMAVFSFHPVKTIAMGEGGLVATADPMLDARLRRLRSHGIERDPSKFEHADAAFEDGKPNPWYYELAELGWNYRASDINCALGLSQLKKLDRFLARRRALADRYDSLFASHVPLIRPVPRPAHQQGGWHLYPVLIDFVAAGTTRAKVMRRLADEGIMTQVHYIPTHRQPYYRRRYGEIDLPGADAYYARCLSLPLFVGMNDEDPDRVVDALSRVLGG